MSQVEAQNSTRKPKQRACSCLSWEGGGP